MNHPNATAMLTAKHRRPLAAPRRSQALLFLLLLDILQKLHKLLIGALKLNRLSNPRRGVIEAAHLEQTEATAPPRLGVADALELDAAVGIDGGFGPRAAGHVRLRAVRKQRRQLLARQPVRLPPRPPARHLDPQRVQFDRLAVLPPAEGCVARFAHLRDLRAALGVYREGRRRHRVRRFGGYERAVERVERLEFG